MGFKKLIFIYSLVVLVIFSFVIFISYGYYVGGSTGTFTATTSDGLDVLFVQSKSISTSNLVPIYSDQVDTEAETNEFSVTFDNRLSGHSVAMQIRLVDIVIDNNLKDASFKWQLLEGSNVINSGNFASLSTSTLNLTSLSTVSLSSYPTTKNYTLRIYLEEICSDLTDVTTCSDYSAWQSAYSAGTELYPYNSKDSTSYGQSRMMNKSFSATIEVYSLIK